MWYGLALGAPMHRLLIAVLFVVVAAPTFGQKLAVKIINRQEN
jgi:hypothetical protein